MKVLVDWDNTEEAELIVLYLEATNHEVVVAKDQADLIHEAAHNGRWDIVLICTDNSNSDGAFETFTQLRTILPEVPIVGACKPDDVYRLARFLTNGMRTYVIRDKSSDFIFMLLAILESTHQAAHAERERQMAEKLREQMDSVRMLQESIIPKSVCSPEGYSITARYEPSQLRVMGGRPVVLAGGDYYDVFALDENRLVLLLGDAAGHGLRACMSILTMHTLIRMIGSRRHDESAAFVTEVNRHLCEHSIVTGDGGFITLLFGILRAETGEFQWSSAGHQVPLLQDLETNKVRPIGTEEDGGFPLGIMPEADYESYAVTLKPKTRLLLYTDGLEEAFPEREGEHRSFGQHGIIAALQRTQSQSSDLALRALFDASAGFTGTSGRHDDSSAILVERQ